MLNSSVVWNLSPFSVNIDPRHLENVVSQGVSNVASGLAERFSATDNFPYWLSVSLEKQDVFSHNYELEVRLIPIGEEVATRFVSYNWFAEVEHKLEQGLHFGDIPKLEWPGSDCCEGTIRVGIIRAMPAIGSKIEYLLQRSFRSILVSPQLAALVKDAMETFSPIRFNWTTALSFKLVTLREVNSGEEIWLFLGAFPSIKSFGTVCDRLPRSGKMESVFFGHRYVVPRVLR